MKRNVLLTVAAVAVLIASLAINLSTNKSSANNVNLAELIQTASADEYWSFTMCVDPFMGQSWHTDEPNWWLGAMYDVPVDYVAGPVECCLAGGMDPCMAPIHVEDIFVKYGPLQEEILEPMEGRWVGGLEEDLMRDPQIWNPSQFNIVRTVAGNMHPVAHQVNMP